MQLQKNYYELLGVPRDATGDQIKLAYKELARIYHPDSNFYTEIIEDAVLPEQSQFFKALTLAYNTLSNRENRARYDETLPPELRDWEAPAEPEPQRPSPRDSRTGSETYIFGTSNPNSSFFDNVAVKEVRSVSEMMSVKRGNKGIYYLSLIAPFFALISIMALVTALF